MLLYVFVKKVKEKKYQVRKLQVIISLPDKLSKTGHIYQHQVLHSLHHECQYSCKDIKHISRMIMSLTIKHMLCVLDTLTSESSAQ